MSEIETHRLYSGGEWKNAADGAGFDVHEPYSGKLMARVAAAGAADATTAIEAAQTAFPAWAAMPPTKRAASYLKVIAHRVYACSTRRTFRKPIGRNRSGARDFSTCCAPSRR